jgi:hypothetical protein
MDAGERDIQARDERDASTRVRYRHEKREMYRCEREMYRCERKREMYRCEREAQE